MYLSRDLNIFNPLTLKELDDVSLMKRYDSKFIFHMDELSGVLEELRMNYSILEIGGKRIFRYENVYYDTDDRQFYLCHHNKKMNRQKVRFRRYTDSAKCYLEIKSKNNKSITVKERLKLSGNKYSGRLDGRSREFVENHLNKNDVCLTDAIRPSLFINFNRITLVDLVNKERLTIDTDLEFTDGNSNVKKIGDLVIAELKQENPSRHSAVIHCLRNRNIRPARFSKYCMGMVLTDKNIKYNRFKMRLTELSKYDIK